MGVMNIEELSKSQLILLTILVNFITSVATGILTVSFLDQAPPVVTQTINRVVDHTIEKVVEVAPTVISSPAPSTQDLVMSAISASASRTVSIKAAGAATSSPAIAVGAYLPVARAIVTATRESLPAEVMISFADGERIAASFSRSGDGVSIYGFADNATLPKVSKPALIPATDLRLGQTVIGIALDGSATTGIVSKINTAGVFTTLPEIGAGSAAVDLGGNIVGIVPLQGVPGQLLGADVISILLAAAPTAN